jgi:hypothetical protein
MSAQEKSSWPWICAAVIVVIVGLTIINSVILYQFHSIKKTLASSSSNLIATKMAEIKILQRLQQNKVKLTSKKI